MIVGNKEMRYGITMLKNSAKILARVARFYKNIARSLPIFLQNCFEISCKILAQILQDFSTCTYSIQYNEISLEQSFKFLQDFFNYLGKIFEQGSFGLKNITPKTSASVIRRRAGVMSVMIAKIFEPDFLKISEKL
jgi:hypothetical protein